MSIKVMSKVWERSAHKGGALLMMLAVADFADDNGVAYPSETRLAHKCRTSPRHVRRLIGALAESGELSVTSGAGRGRTSRYQVELARLGERCPQCRGAEKEDKLSGFSEPPPETGNEDILSGFEGAPSVSLNEDISDRNEDISDAQASTETRTFPTIKEDISRTEKRTFPTDSIDPPLDPSKNRQVERARTRASRLDPDWSLPDEWREWAESEWPQGDVGREAEIFRDHWIAAAGARAAKRDWAATWRNWIRRAKEQSRGRTSRRASALDTLYRGFAAGADPGDAAARAATGPAAAPRGARHVEGPGLVAAGDSEPGGGSGGEVGGGGAGGEADAGGAALAGGAGNDAAGPLLGAGDAGSGGAGGGGGLARHDRRVPSRSDRRGGEAVAAERDEEADPGGDAGAVPGRDARGAADAGEAQADRGGPRVEPGGKLAVISQLDIPPWLIAWHRERAVKVS